MKGLLADINAIGYVRALVRLMQEEPWREFWDSLNLCTPSFEDLGLMPTSSDLIVWQLCQEKELILITDNRNEDSHDSLEAVLKRFNQPKDLPVITISNLDKLRNNRQFAQRVIEKLFEYLLYIDDFRGAGRLYVP